MNWLERARREIEGSIRQPTAATAERTPAAVTAVPCPGHSEKPAPTVGGGDSSLPRQMLDPDALHEAFEERAAIMEHDGGLEPEIAEETAWALVSKRHRLH